MPLTPYIGQIMPAGFGITPKGWLPCNGQILAINTNQALFALLGTAFGGNGVTTFALPDLRGRAVLGSNFGSVAWGQVSGTETVTLTTAQLPAHNHVLATATGTGSGGRGGVSPASNLFGTNNQGSPVTSIFGAPGSAEIALSVGTNITNAGGSAPHNNMQPSLVINYLMATSGIFPSRS